MPSSPPQTISSLEKGRYGKDSNPNGSDWNLYIFLAGLTTSLSSFTFGLNISIIDGPKDVFTSCTDPGSGLFPSCIQVQSYWNCVVAAFCVGGLVGALSAGYLTNSIGRKKVLLLHNLAFIAGSALLSFSVNLAMLIIGRLLIGIASGVCTIVVPLYLSEISTDRIRGTIGTMHQSAIVIGILVAQLLAIPLGAPDSWRYLFAVPGILSLIQLSLLPFFYETPTFLAKKGRNEEAHKALARLRGSNDTREEFLLLTTKDSSNNVVKSIPLTKLIFLSQARKSLLVGSIYHMTQQLSGINALFYFSKTIFQNVGIDLNLIPVTVGSVNVLMTAVSVWLMDRAGRRPLALASSSLMALAGVMITVSFVYSWHIPTLLFALIFVGSFAVGMGPVPWVIVGDIFPTEAIDAGMFLGIGINWICNAIIALSTESLAVWLNYLYLFVPFTVILVLYFFFVLLYVPETKGMPSSYL